MKKVIAFYCMLYIFIFSMITAMESNNLVTDMWNKIIAQVSDADKNILSYTCTTLNRLSKRTNHYIYIHSPLVLSERNLITGLLYATHYKNKMAVKNLLKHGADPHTSIHLSLLPLTLAKYNNNNDLIQILKKYNARNDTVMCSLYSLAAFVGDLPLFKKCIDKEKKLISFEKMYSSDPFLHSAIFNGHTQIVEYILKTHSISHVKNICYSNQTALYYATLHNRSAIIELLLKACPHMINDVCSHGFSALHLATFKKYYHIVQLLLTHPNIDNNKLDREHNTPLHIAVYNKDVLMIQLFLVQPNINIHIKNKQKQSPWDIANTSTNDIKQLFIERSSKTYFYQTRIAPWEQHKKI